MKIIEQTTDLLVVKDSGVFNRISGLILALFAILVGYFCLLIASNSIFDFGIMSMFVLVAFVGSWMFLYATDILVSIDKKDNKIAFLKKRVIGSQKSSWSFEDVSLVETRWISQYVGNIGYVPSATMSLQSVIVLKNKKEVPLNNFNSRYAWRLLSDLLFWIADIFYNNQENISVAPLVASFIGVPFKEVNKPRV